MASSRKKLNRLVNLRPQKKGARQVLGDLEADIMEVLWQESPASVRDVYKRLAKRRPIAYTTVMTVMNRLAEKNLLKREQQGRAYLYVPCQTRDEFCTSTVNTVMLSLLGGFGDPVLSNFIDTVAAEDAGKLDDLIQLIEAKKGNTQ